MKVEFIDNRIVLVLSRRNLLTLLAKLDGYPAGSACSIMGGTDAPGVIVRAEEDNVHYRLRNAGVMHPATEGAVSGVSKRRPLCAVCGMEIESHAFAVCIDHPKLSVPTAERGVWVHAPSCKERYWDEGVGGHHA